MSTNMKAFLYMLRCCEGTDSDEGYQALFGFVPGNGRIFTDFSDHPNIPTHYTQKDGTTITTTAAGAYQFIHRTWEVLKERLGLPDFSPASQDAAAEDLIREKGATEAVESGLIQNAIDLCAPIWASLPASTVPQPHRTFEFASAAYQQAGGSLVPSVKMADYPGTDPT